MCMISEGEDIIILPPDSMEALAEELPEVAPKWATFHSGARPTVLTAEFLGPRPMYGEYWSDGTVSGRISYVLPHPTDPNIIYVAAASGGVWRTTDGGTTWEPLTDGLPVLSSGALAFDPTDPNVIYYGTGEQHYCGWSCFPGDGLFVSTDAGNTWVKLATTDEVGSYISEIWIRPDDPNVIFVASEDGLARSADGGTTWSWVFTAGDVNSIAVRSDDYDIMFIGVYGEGVFVSTDGGDTWSQITDLPTADIERVELAISPSDPDVIYASFTDTLSALYGLYKSTDGGATWLRLNGTPDYLYSQGNYDHHITVHPLHPDTVFAGGVFPYDTTRHGIVRTFDGGNAWEDITDRTPNGKVHPDIHHFAWGTDGALYVACDGGLWRSYDLGDSWENLNEGLGITQFYTVDIHPDLPDVVVGGTQDNGTAIWYSDWGDDWENVRSGDGGPVLWLPFAPDSFLTTYVSMTYLKMYEWTGSTFNYVAYLGTPWSGDVACWTCGPLKGDPDGDTRTLYAGTSRLWMSTDGGETWFMAADGLVSSSYGYLMSMAVSPSLDTLYVGSSSADFKVSFDGGSTWISRTLPDVSTWEDITDIWINPSDASEVYATIKQTYGAKVVHSTDAGATWTDITGNLPDEYVYSLAVDFRTTPHTLFVGTRRGLFYTTDQVNWTFVSSVPSAPIYQMDIFPEQNFIVVATHGRGMWKVYLPTAVSVAERGEESVVPVALHGRRVVARSHVRIYTVDGRLIATLQAGQKREMDPGAYFALSEVGVFRFVVR
ncbi:MAG: hypothetical protein GXO29_00305 [Thermotogae bacterium]|nr:hypothetical protein [Thermotogota bacterium]